MAGSKYTVLVQAQIDPAQLQQQLNKVGATKPIKVKITPEMKKEDINRQVQLWNNAVSKMQAMHPGVFDNAEVIKQTTLFNQMIEGYKVGAVPIKDVRVQLDNVRTSVAEVSGAMRNVNRDGMAMGDMFTLATKKVAIWLGATTAIYGTLRQIGEGIKFITDLNTELTNIQQVTGLSAQATAELGKQYNKLARELSQTTLEVAKGSEEFLRQGYTIKQTNELLKATIVLAQEGAITSTEATDRLISTINGFNLSASNAMDIVDKLTALDLNYAASADEISTALARSSSVATQAKVSFDELAAWITTVESITRQSAESIGTAMRSIMQRMIQVKAGAKTDEFGDSLNNVDKVLQKYNIHLRDTSNNFKPLGDIIGEVANKWDTYNDAQKSQIVTAIAGQRQSNYLYALLQNYPTVLKAMATATDSAGTAMQRYDIYQQSVEAHVKTFKATWEETWSSTLNSDVIKFFVDLGTSILQVIGDAGGLIEAINNLIEVLNPAIGLIIEFRRHILGPAQAGADEALGNFADAIKGIAIETDKSKIILDAYSKAINSTSRAYEDAGIASDIFGTKGKNIDRLLKQTLDVLKDNTNNWKDYNDAAQEAIKLAGYNVDEQGKLYKVIDGGQGGLRKAYSNISMLSKAEKDSADEAKGADKALGNLTDAYLALRSAASKANNIVFDSKSAFEDLQNAVSGKLLKAWNDFISKQNDLEQKLAVVKEKMKEASALPATQEQRTELFNLQQQYDDLTQQIAANAAEHRTATNQIIFDIFMQRIANADLGKEAQQTAYTALSAWAQSVGLISQADAQALNDINDVIAQIMNGTITTSAQAVAAIQQVGASAQSISGNYPINFIVTTSYRTGGPGHSFGGGSQFGGEDISVPNQPIQPKTPQINIPPGGFYPSGLGGGGGGGSKKKAIKEEQYSLQDLYNMVISKIRQEKQDEKDLLKQHQETIQAQRDALQQQLDSYKEIIDARKKILQTQEDELSYQEEIAGKNKDIANIQNQLAILKLDTSQESKAKQLDLQEQLNKQLDDLAKTQREHSTQEAQDALDAEYTKYQKTIDAQDQLLQSQSDGIQSQIDQIDEFLGKSGLVAQAALDRIQQNAPSLYKSLIDWNKEYGSGIDEDVTKAWNEAYKALKKYKNLIDAISGSAVPGEGSPISDTLPVHHTGLSSGPVGGLNLPHSEVVTKLLKGEIVLDQNDIANVIPNFAKMAGNFISGGNLSVGNLINIEGNVDKTVIPQIKEISKQVMNEINNEMLKRGFTRGARLYQT